MKLVRNAHAQIHQTLQYHISRNKERFISRVAGLVDTSAGREGCWLWRGTIKHNGYGCINFRLPGNKHIQFGAHAMFWVLAHQRNVRPGFELDHTCQNPVCVNPAHLEEVPVPENKRRVHQRR